jgi:glycerate kinase
LNVLIIPDSFKGSLSAVEVSKKIYETVKKIMPESVVNEFPFSDGGEGALNVLINNIKGKLILSKTVDPLGRKINAPFFLFENKKTAWVELSQASGINLLKKTELDPFKTSTFGTGIIIKKALEMGCEKIYLGIGGSSTHDLGSGIFVALGGKLLDKNKNEIPLGGGSLNKCTEINIDSLHNKIDEAQIIVASDVNNPLIGENGAAKIYSKQKGASEKETIELEKNSIYFSSLIQKFNSKEISSIKGGGAAGGTAAGLYGLINSKINNGFDILKKISDLEKIISKSNLVITGEGHFDNQSLNGKLPIKIAEITSKYKIPTIILTGKKSVNEKNLKDFYFKVYSINPPNISFEKAVKETRQNISIKMTEILNHFIKSKTLL